jgi:hypothetical protein
VEAVTATQQLLCRVQIQATIASRIFATYSCPTNQTKSAMAEPREDVSRTDPAAPTSPPADVTDAGWDPYIVALTNGVRSPDPHGIDDRSDWTGDSRDSNATRRGQVMAWLRNHRS